MCLKNAYILCFVLLSINEIAFTQQTSAISDSTKLYENIETYSKRTKLTRFIYGLVFKPIQPRKTGKRTKDKEYKKLIKKPYRLYEGKIIRNIHIETLDPFGFSTTDTALFSKNTLYKVGNRLHIKTRRITIKNLILIKKNEPFDSLLVRESERLIRSQQYVHEVSFKIAIVGKKHDSVDVYIRELDIWSIIPVASISPSKISANITDKNFLGLGHQFQFAVNTNPALSHNSFYTNYHIPNIKNTYISTKLHYGVDGLNNYNRTIAIDRPFFSSFARWAAGVSFSQQIRLDSFYRNNALLLYQRYQYQAQDYWVGSALQIFKGNTEDNRTTNFITSIRMLQIHYFDKPKENFDSLNIYSNQLFYLASIGISTRKYVQDRYIFSFGVIEDIPIGKVYSITGGYQLINGGHRKYLGARVSLGNYYPWGYLSSNIEYGTFFQSSTAEQSVFITNIKYFTGLMEIGRWKVRQFVKPEIIVGINRFSYDSLTLKSGTGIDGFNSTNLTGTSRLLVTVQTQSYAPWNFYGFRFGPFIEYSMGMLGDETNGFQKSRVYSQLGVGVLIKNENLIFSMFQLSISFYPIIPGFGQNVFKINSYKTTDFGFSDFYIGKPLTVTYQ